MTAAPANSTLPPCIQQWFTGGRTTAQRDSARARRVEPGLRAACTQSR
ncbi:hypothetical protein [Streptomyces canus]